MKKMLLLFFRLQIIVIDVVIQKLLLSSPKASFVEERSSLSDTEPVCQMFSKLGVPLL